MLDMFPIGDLQIYRSVYEFVNSNMYVIFSENEAIIFDPHRNEELTELLNKQGIQNITILLTHEHHDHTSGIYWYQKYFETTIICQEFGAKWMVSSKYLRPTLLLFIIGERDKVTGDNNLELFKHEYVACNYKTDVTFNKELQMDWHGHQLMFYHIPGHSKGSSLIVIDNQYAFTGDSLLKDIPIITRFQDSSHKDYLIKALPTIQRKLKGDMTIFPGHGNPFLYEELLNNNILDVRFR